MHPQHHPGGNVMSRISPAPADRLAGLAADFEKAGKQRGYVPNSWLTLARKPRVFRLVRELHFAREHLTASGWTPGVHAK